MYATALLTKSHVFDDDSPVSSFDRTSEDFRVSTKRIGENNGDEVKGTKPEASGPRLRDSETVVQDQILCRSKYFRQYLPRINLPYITFVPKIDPEPPSTFQNEGLLTTHAQYRI